VGRRLAVVTAVVAALVAPAAAHAATYGVAAGGGGCGGADTACGTIAAAAGAARAGDGVTIAPGAYTENAAFAAGNVTITGSTDAPGVVVTGTLTFSGSGTGPSVLQKLIVAAPAGSGPAVAATGGAGVAVRDAVLLSADGPGLSITAGAANELTRSSVLAAAAGATGVDIALGADAANLTIDSSVVSGGASGVSLAVKTGIGTLVSAGSASVTARHVTVAGAATAVALDSSGATGVLASQGNIVVTATDSIVQGATARKNNAGLLGVLSPNTAALTLTRTDQAATAAALFANPAKRNYHLRADAPVIDKGKVTAGESATDIDGQPRTTGAASDLGADEFANTAPTAMIAVKTPTPRATVPVTFDGSGSLDREAGLGGGVAEYRWTFGDGSTETTAAPTVDHIYAKPGTVVAQLVVADRQGAASEPATTPVALGSGTAPTVAITRPKPRATIARLAKKRKGAKQRKRARISFAGTAQAATDVRSVVVTIEKLGVSTKTCTWLDRKKGLVKAPCAQPVLIAARLGPGTWTYTVAGSIKLPKGSYRVSAYGTDGGGTFGNAAPAKRRIVRFTLK
jgi:hypothetical protein